MSTTTQVSVSRGLNGFHNYQYVPGLVKEPMLGRFCPTNIAACGVFSVHHAFVFLGQGHAIGNIQMLHSKFVSLISRGLEVDQLTPIIRKYGAKSDTIESWEIGSIKAWVDKHLRTGYPVILGSEPAVHWICLGGVSNGNYVWADSAEGMTVGTSTWEELVEWMTLNEEGEEAELEGPFEAIAVLPGKNMPASRSIVPWVGGIWDVWASDNQYARNWGNLLADMLEVFWDEDDAKDGIPAGEFLEANSDAIVEAVSSMNGWKKSVVREHADAYQDVADFHSLGVDPGQEDATIARFSLMLQARLSVTDS